MSHLPNADESARWNGPTGGAWAEHQAAMDATHRGSLALLLEAARLFPGDAVLDIGCGTGASTLAAAEVVGVEGTALGLDISEPLLALAQSRTAAAGSPARFTLADAQTDDLGEACYTHAISRFGVMFFADPAAAFANIARALRPGGRVAFLGWGPLEENPWFAVPRQAAIARLGAPSPRDPLAPGPLAFADAARAGRLLEAGGLVLETAEYRDLALTPPGGLAGGADLAFRFGPAGRIIEEKGGTEADARAIREGIATALAPFDSARGMAIPARLTLLTAHRP